MISSNVAAAVLVAPMLLITAPLKRLTGIAEHLQRGLSAGHVQSPALRMIVEREEEIEAFKARAKEAFERLPPLSAILSAFGARRS